MTCMNSLALVLVFACWSMMPEDGVAQGIGGGGLPGLCRTEPQCSILSFLVNGPEKCSKCAEQCACTCKRGIGGCVLACVAAGANNCPQDCTLLGAEFNLACLQVLGK